MLSSYCIKEALIIMNVSNSLFLLSLAWLAYFVMHSVLASLWLKQAVAKHYSKVMPFYRLLFNGVAFLALLPVLAYMRSLSGDILWLWQGGWQWLAYALTFISVVGFVHSLKFYDMQEFVGIRQVKEKSIAIEDQENLHLSPYHRFVRHPWYFFSIVIIWVQNMDTAWLISSILLTLYFWLGSRLEDRKLVAYYGDRYKLYKEKVGGIFPLPWRFLSATKAEEIQQKRE